MEAGQGLQVEGEVSRSRKRACREESRACEGTAGCSPTSPSGLWASAEPGYARAGALLQPQSRSGQQPPWNLTQIQAPGCVSSLNVDGQWSGLCNTQTSSSSAILCSLGLGDQLSATKMVASRQNLNLIYKLLAWALDNATWRCPGDGTGGESSRLGHRSLVPLVG